jgi:TolB-like protein
VSDDAGQEFFSDGMTDEIMTALAKIPDLRVVARASAFQFKGQNRGLPVDRIRPKSREPAHHQESI